jgi:hypothetical protein
MRNTFTSLIISIAVIVISLPSFADDDREDKNGERVDKEERQHSKKEEGRKGGRPRCEAELAECLINLSEKENLLQACEDDLAQCQATAGQAFPATGQTSCWDSDGSAIDCAGTGQDGDIQAGATLSYTDNGLTITDNNTKLEWMKQDDNDSLGTIICDPGSYPGNLDKNCLFDWDGAFAFVAELNARNHAGYSDWRVPNVKELQSIVNHENFDPAVSVEFDTGCVFGCTVDACSCTNTGLYWSSTSFADGSFVAWGVFLSSGIVNLDDKSEFKHVRAVRGGL